VLADCVPGHFPAAGWWVLAYVDAGPADAREADLRGAIVSASNDQVLADAVIDHLAPWARADGWHGKASLADLDGDGIDEVMVESSLSHGGTDDTSLRILRLDGARLAAALDLQTRYSDAMARDDEDAATECDAKVDVGPRDAAGKRHLIVTATVDAGPKADPATVEDCVPAGRSDYVLVGDRLEKQ